MHQASAFVTLTYEDCHLPPGSSLALRDLQLFMKRLRKVRPAGLRFFACGEYGDTYLRPHYHVLLLNECFPDMVFYKRTRTGYNLYRSRELERLWPYGFADIGEVTAESVAYVAKYVLKKFVGRQSDYGSREPEFRVMSRNPGLGLPWFEKYYTEAYAHDSAIVDAREVKLPRYYDDKFEAIDGDRLDELKSLRQRSAEEHWPDNTRDRLFVRERFENLKAKRFARDPQ